MTTEIRSASFLVWSFTPFCNQGHQYNTGMIGKPMRNAIFACDVQHVFVRFSLMTHLKAM